MGSAFLWREREMKFVHIAIILGIILIISACEVENIEGDTSVTIHVDGSAAKEAGIAPAVEQKDATTPVYVPVKSFCENKQCDDAIDCTIDSCNEATGECVHHPSDAMCFSSKERCIAKVEGHVAVPGCVECTVNSECDDGDGSTNDHCGLLGKCYNDKLEPTANPCDDGDPITSDYVDEDGTCFNPVEFKTTPDWHGHYPTSEQYSGYQGDNTVDHLYDKVNNVFVDFFGNGKVLNWDLGKYTTLNGPGRAWNAYNESMDGYIFMTGKGLGKNFVPAATGCGKYAKVDESMFIGKTPSSIGCKLICPENGPKNQPLWHCNYKPKGKQPTP
jgi:hypothetical protein